MPQRDIDQKALHDVRIHANSDYSYDRIEACEVILKRVTSGKEEIAPYCKILSRIANPLPAYGHDNLQAEVAQTMLKIAEEATIADKITLHMHFKDYLNLMCETSKSSVHIEAILEVIEQLCINNNIAYKTFEHSLLTALKNNPESTKKHEEYAFQIAKTYGSKAYMSSPQTHRLCFDTPENIDPGKLRFTECQRLTQIWEEQLKESTPLPLIISAEFNQKSINAYILKPEDITKITRDLLSGWNTEGEIQRFGANAYLFKPAKDKSNDINIDEALTVIRF